MKAGKGEGQESGRGKGYAVCQTAYKREAKN